MSEKRPSLPKLKATERCESPADLFVSRKFKTFLALYNRQNKTKVDVQQILGNYDVAKDVYEFARNCSVPGGTTMRIIEDIHTLALEILAEVKERHLDRVLPQVELIERMDQMGFDIEQIARSIAETNTESGYGEALKEAGVLGEREDYTLPLPAITEEKMRILEAAHENNKFDEVFIDDARLTDKETFLLHPPSGARRPDKRMVAHVGESIPISPEGLKELEELGGEDKYNPPYMFTHYRQIRADQEQPNRGVRLLAYKSNIGADTHSAMGQNGGNSLNTGTVSKSENLSSISLGTYLRLTAHLAETKPELFRKLNLLYITADPDDHACPSTYKCETLLNNVDKQGKGVMIKNHTLNGRYKIQWINPAEISDSRTVKGGFYL